MKKILLFLLLILLPELILAKPRLIGGMIDGEGFKVMISWDGKVSEHFVDRGVELICSECLEIGNPKKNIYYFVVNKNLEEGLSLRLMHMLMSHDRVEPVSGWFTFDGMAWHERSAIELV